VRISRLVLVTSNLPTSTGYYVRLLGQRQGAGRSASFLVGQSEFVLAPHPDTESIRVAVQSFDPQAVRRTLTSLGVSSDVGSDGRSVSILDPDGIRIEIGG
jgi:catechol 2,3-dioxygenase-like lactoylglutathione lyase family enzyme